MTALESGFLVSPFCIISRHVVYFQEFFIQKMKKKMTWVQLLLDIVVKNIMSGIINCNPKVLPWRTPWPQQFRRNCTWQLPAFSPSLDDPDDCALLVLKFFCCCVIVVCFSFWTHAVNLKKKLLPFLVASWTRLLSFSSSSILFFSNANRSVSYLLHNEHYWWTSFSWLIT